MLLLLPPTMLLLLPPTMLLLLQCLTLLLRRPTRGTGSWCHMQMEGGRREEEEEENALGKKRNGKLSSHIIGHCPLNWTVKIL
eukprot:235373-Hanusia_phi.AAC.1